MQSRSLRCLLAMAGYTLFWLELEVADADFVVAGDVEAEFAVGEIAASLRPGVERQPGVSVFDAMHHVVGHYVDQDAEGLLIVDTVLRLLAVLVLAVGHFLGPESLLV